MITIVGAGPVGCFAAYLLAKAGKEVQILEEHDMVGHPVQCTGLVTSSIQDVLRLPRHTIVNQTSKSRIFAPNNSYVDVDFSKKNIVLDRRSFDQAIAEMAKRAGADILLGHRFVNSRGNMIHARCHGKLRKVKTSILIGADGPLSQVAKANNLWGKRNFWIGLQARVRLKNDNAIEFYPFIGAFGWVVPESEDTARIGVLAPTDAKAILEQFLRQRLHNPKVIDRQAGLVPIHNPSLLSERSNIFLVGDAATQVKATTGGGLIPGMIAARCLSESILAGKDYHKLWKKGVGRSLQLHLLIRKALDRFTEEDYNRLVALCSGKKASSSLATIDRDNPMKLILSLLGSEPRMLRFAKYLF
jgi:digeranylgeranylglycerophospholipid reductase